MHKKVIEAALFMTNKPLKLKELSRIVGVSSLGYVREVIEGLKDEYKERGIDITEFPDGWMMHVKQDLLNRVKHLTPYSDLAEGHKRALAIIAYKEPLKQSDLIKIQGNKAYNYIKFLEKKGLIKSEKEGRTKTLLLTAEFERYFGDTRANIREKLMRRVSETSLQEPDSEEFTEE
ncbi:MAG: SMC-Scp complex subunit ScpB [Candidatus Aenigmarchaeota archaeon]|nr:SMC-Scp complex subunit ScpB [Candidatus Aenigmarchaeota archaeon]